LTVAERLQLIDAICRFEGRRSGTDAERRAANELAERLRINERHALVEPTYVRPQLGLIFVLHCAAAIGASLVAIFAPMVSFALVLLVAVSLYLDLNGHFYILRRLLFRRASQNVVSTGIRPEAAATVVLCAHLDAGRSGAVYWARFTRTAVWLSQKLGIPAGPFRLLFAAVSLLLVPVGARMAGLDAAWMDITQLALIAVLLLAIFLLMEIELSGIGPGANDNASGVATVLSLARVLDAEPPNALDVWVVLSGAEEPIHEGMRAFIRAHSDELDPATTSFINVDAVGRGHLRYEITAGWVISYGMGGRLAELAAAIANAENECPASELDPEPANEIGKAVPSADLDESRMPLPLRRSSAGDSLPPRLAGYDAITITCRDELDLVPDLRTFADTPEALDPNALESSHEFILELIRQLDRDVSCARHQSTLPTGC
jgi:hypothetical protein